jgi:hypothetical protein
VIASSSVPLNEQLFDFIRQTRARCAVHAFDFEPSLCDTAGRTSPTQLFSFLEALRRGGRAPQLIAPDLGFEDGRPYEGSLDELSDRVKALADVARQFQCTLSIHNGTGKQPEVQEIIGRATLGRFNYEVSAHADIPAIAGNLLA